MNTTLCFSKNRSVVRIIGFTILLSAFAFRASAEEFTDAIHAYLQHSVSIGTTNCGIVDEHGSTVVSYGKLDNGTDRELNGNTLFEIGSVTKTFTGLLLQDMVARQEMKLDDPVAKYLPNSIKVPSRNGTEITLLQLATHTSGLPTSSISWIPKRADNPRADYTIEKMYEFVSGYKLTRDPGTKYEYSTVGMALLGQAIALKSGTDYESLVAERICRPLMMDSTRIKLTPESKARLAIGHNFFGYAMSSSYWGALMPGAGLRSTVNDLLKYVSANLGLTQSRLTPIMEQTHLPHFHAGLETDTGRDTDLGLAWMITHEPSGAHVIEHGGLTGGFIAFVCFDKARRRGVVILANSQGFDVPAIGTFLLECEWQSDRRPKDTKIDSRFYDSLVGGYQQSHSVGESAPPGIGIRREGDRLFAQITGSRRRPTGVLLPPIAAELLPELEAVLFDRLSGTSLTFSRDVHDNVTCLTIHHEGEDLIYDKTSAEPPTARKPLGPRVAITLDTTHLDAYVGNYVFEPNGAHPTVAELTTWRDGDQMLGQFSGANMIQGAIDIYAESETTFFLKIDGSQLIFVKNYQGEVTAVIRHKEGQSDIEGRKVGNQ